MTPAPAFLADERRRYPQIFDLARALSLATWIDRALVRAMRLEIAPSSDSGIESDLWFSPIVQVRSPRLTLLPAVLAVLRDELKADPGRTLTRRAWKVISRVHGIADTDDGFARAAVAPVVALEERITYLATMGGADDLARVDLLLGRALASIRDHHDQGVARWAVRTLPRLPENVRHGAAALALARAASVQMGGIPVVDVVSAPSVPGTGTWTPELLSSLPSVDVGLRVVSDGLEITEPPVAQSVRVAVRETSPLVLDVRYPSPGGWFLLRAALPRASRQVAPVPVGPPLRIATIDGGEYRLEPRFDRSLDAIQFFDKTAGASRRKAWLTATVQDIVGTVTEVDEVTGSENGLAVWRFDDVDALVRSSASQLNRTVVVPQTAFVWIGSHFVASSPKALDEARRVGSMSPVLLEAAQLFRTSGKTIEMTADTLRLAVIDAQCERARALIVRPARIPVPSPSLAFINVQDQYKGPSGTFSEDGGHALIAAIVEGIDVLHRAFLDADGRSRILGIWDQRDKSGPPPAGFDFGKFYGQQEIQEFIRRDTVPIALTRNKDGHGTHVTSIAAGRAVGEFGGGVAPNARVLVVIRADDDFTRAYLAALALVDRFAAETNLPVVVAANASIGTGSHDGRSDLEVGIDEFSGGGRKPGRIVVASAGNRRDAKAHARLELVADSADSLAWHTNADPTWNREKLEVWWDSSNSLRFRLTSPGGAQSPWVDESNPLEKGRLSTGGPFRIELIKRHPWNGDSRLLVELGFGPGLHLLAEGDWTLDIEAVSVKKVAELHAWLEGWGTRPSEFVSHTNEQFTIGTPATAFSTVAVGAIKMARPLQLAPFSSLGPTRDLRQKPDVVAPGVDISGARGGTFDGVINMSGGSVAMSHVVGAVALLLSRAARSDVLTPTASQTSAALRGGAGDSEPRFHPGFGFGVVNVRALLEAF